MRVATSYCTVRYVPFLMELGVGELDAQLFFLWGGVAVNSRKCYIQSDVSKYFQKSIKQISNLLQDTDVFVICFLKKSRNSNMYKMSERQNKMSENIDEFKVEMMISTVLKPVCFGHFILSRKYTLCPE